MGLFWSPDPLAQAVISALALLFALWLLLLLRAALRLTHERKRFERLKEVDALVAEGRGAEGVSPAIGSRDALFVRFLKGRNVDPRTVAARHVRAVFEAGWSDSRLDVTELNRFTMDRLFRPNALLKSVLSLFIIVGLFGTLAGLSKALVPLSAINLTSSGVAPELAGDLQDLLVKLRSAFAPSVAGVFLTVVGVLLYAAYLGRVCAPCATGSTS